MFVSQQLLTGKGPLRTIWVAAYFFKKLKRSQVTHTDVSSTVDKILETEFGEVAYRVLACLLLGVVRIYSKKVEYLFADCNKVLLMVRDFSVARKDDILVEKMCNPYFSITLPETFELDSFDLGIADETHRENVASLDEITLKDGTMEYVEKRKSFGKGHLDDVVNSWDPCLGSPTFGDDDPEFTLMDFDKEVGIFLNAKLDLPGSSHSHQKGSMHLESLSGGEVHAMFENFSQDFQSVEGNVIPQAGNLVQVHEHALSKEASINVDKSTTVEGEPANDFHSYSGICASETEIIKDPHSIMAQPETEMRPISLEACNRDDSRKLQVSKEKPNQSDEGFVPTVDIEMLEELPQGAKTPDFLATPAAKERVRLSRKRKCACDDVMVLPNRILKQQIEDASDLVCKRKKFPRSSLGIWRFHRISKLSQSFLDPLIPYSSPELRSLFDMERLKISNSVDTLNQAEVHAPNSPACGSSVVDRSAKKHVGLLNVAEISHILMSMEMVELSDKEEIPDSFEIMEPKEQALKFGRSVEVPARMLEAGVPTQVGVQSDAGELSRKGEMHIFVEAEESREYLSAMGSPGVGWSADVPAAMPNAPESSHAAMSGEMVEPADKEDAPDGRGRLLEEQLIAPETPTRQMTSLRSFERPEISDCLSPEFHVQQEPSLNVGYSGINCMNEEMDSHEVDNQTGFSERTRVVMTCLNANFLHQRRHKGQDVVRLLPLLEGKPRKESARMFHEILVLGTNGCVSVGQEEAYGDILIRKTARWDQALGSNGF